MILILTLAGCENSWDIRGLVEIHPQAAHGVVHARENLHRRGARVVADKFFVNLEYPFQLAVEGGTINMRQVEINHRLAINAEVVFENNFENGAGRDIARNQVAVLRIPLFEKIPPIALRN